MADASGLFGSDSEKESEEDTPPENHSSSDGDSQSASDNELERSTLHGAGENASDEDEKSVAATPNSEEALANSRLESSQNHGDSSVSGSPAGVTANEAAGDDSNASQGDEPRRPDSNADDDPLPDVATMADNLFGDADDVSEAGDEQSPNDSDGREQPPQEQEQPEDDIPETKIDVEIPRVTANLGKDVHFVKLPNFLSVETRPFDPATYEDEIDEEDVLDEEGHSRMKLKVENTMRWRYAKNEAGEELRDESGERVRQSNARVVRWSDGSMSLHLGDEIFDVDVKSMQDHNHLFVRQGTGLQGQSIFNTKLSFRPCSTDSFTHRKMTMSLADRSTKLQKIKMLPMTGVDPEAEKTKKLKEAEENLRATIRRENQQRRVRERAHSHPVSARFLEGGDDEDEDGEDGGGVSIAAIKKKYKDKARGRQRRGKASDEEEADDSDAEDMRKKRLQKAKKLDVSDEENSDGSANEADGDSGDGAPSKKKSRNNASDEDD